MSSKNVRHGRKVLRELEEDPNNEAARREAKKIVRQFDHDVHGKGNLPMTREEHDIIGKLRKIVFPEEMPDFEPLPPL